MMRELYDRTDMAVHDEVLRFTYLLSLRQKDCSECLLYHLVVGGTLPEDCRKLDYPGRDSIEAFIRSRHDYYCVDEAVI
ncbi:MAG: hypothetical protein AAFX93_17200 [Verrucomicrobiota bacterium]